MVTVKNHVFIGLQHEKYYLVGEIRIWWGGLPSFPSRENPEMRHLN